MTDREPIEMKKIDVSNIADVWIGTVEYSYKGEWLPISSAPMNGTRILVYRDRESGYDHQRIGIDKWKDGSWWFSRAAMQPTHWMPLPPPPVKPI